MTDKKYEVGYKKPPKANQFQPGQSGNPKGRPNGTKNLATDLQEELSSKIVVREGGVNQEISKQRALLKTLSVKALNGDIRAIAKLIDLAERYIQDEPEKEQEAELHEDDQAILDAFIARHTENSTPKTEEIINEENSETQDSQCSPMHGFSVLCD